MFRKTYHIHFKEGWNLGFLLTMKAWSKNGVRKNVDKIIATRPGKDIDDYEIYTDKELLKLANERVAIQARENAIEEIYQTYLTVWNFTENITKGTNPIDTKLQLSTMELPELNKMRSDVLGNAFNTLENKREIDENLKSHALIKLYNDIDNAMKVHNIALFKINEESSDEETRKALEDYFLLLKRIKTLKSLIEENYYDELIERYSEML